MRIVCFARVLSSHKTVSICILVKKIITAMSASIAMSVMVSFIPRIVPTVATLVFVLRALAVKIVLVAPISLAKSIVFLMKNSIK